MTMLMEHTRDPLMDYAPSNKEVPLSKPKVGSEWFSNMTCLLHIDSHCSVISMFERKEFQALFMGI